MECTLTLLNNGQEGSHRKTKTKTKKEQKNRKEKEEIREENAKPRKRSVSKKEEAKRGQFLYISVPAGNPSTSSCTFYSMSRPTILGKPIDEFPFFLTNLSQHSPRWISQPTLFIHTELLCPRASRLKPPEGSKHEETGRKQVQTDTNKDKSTNESNRDKDKRKHRYGLRVLMVTLSVKKGSHRDDIRTQIQRHGPHTTSHRPNQ